MRIKDDHVLQFKVMLKGVKPPVWRRFQLSCTASFWDLHVAIQDAMGWLDSHLHEFEVRHPFLRTNLAIGIPDEEGYAQQEILPGWLIPVARFIGLDNRRLYYTYDFGDNWEHAVLLEKILPREKGVTYPRCLGGRRACPPEDCGGAGGYLDLLAVLANPDCAEHVEVQAWVGADFDLEHFAPDEIAFDDPDERWQLAFEAEAVEDDTGPRLRVIEGGRDTRGGVGTGRGEGWEQAADLPPDLDDLRRRAARGFQGFPMATIAAYGPDDQRATKLVVGIVADESGEIDALERWTIAAGDIRADARTAGEVQVFLRRRGVVTVVLSDGILGCPHEEGTDYPTGESCPQCPFWSHRDRWSGKPIH